MPTPKLSFLSLFVPDPEGAAKRYAAVFGVEPEPPTDPVPADHPYSPDPPIVFDLGGVKLALYRQDGRTTRTGDVGLGVVVPEPLEDVTARARAAGAHPLPASASASAADRPLGVLMMPERHFFELVSAPESEEPPG